MFLSRNLQETKFHKDKITVSKMAANIAAKRISLLSDNDAINKNEVSRNLCSKGRGIRST